MSKSHSGNDVAKSDHAALRLFYLVRDEDVSGISGIGRVAIGVVFPSGRVVLEWLGADRSFEILDNPEHVERIHGHGGKTRIEFAGIQGVSRVEGYPVTMVLTQLHSRWRSVKDGLGRTVQRVRLARRNGASPMR
jgi:hypothetical protein